MFSGEKESPALKEQGLKKLRRLKRKKAYSGERRKDRPS